MGNIRQGPPEEIVLHLRNTYKVPVFVETGTFLGNTARWASQHFSTVFTIEFAEAIYHQAVSAHQHIAHISFLYGHTREKLAEVVNTLSTPAIFWLDAHWSDGATYGANDECPVLDEVTIILQSAHNHFILIDDARMFLAPPPYPHQATAWPDLNAITQALNAQGERYTLVLEDVIISAPASAKAGLLDYFQNYTTAQLRQKQLAPARPGLINKMQRAYQHASKIARRIRSTHTEQQ